MKLKKKIIIAKKAGFCFGVRRAIEIAEKALKKKNGQIFCLGEIIHNPLVVGRLERKGLEIIQDIKKTKKGDSLIIRSHGVAPEVIKDAKGKGLKIIDATCPFVSHAQNIIADFHKRGLQVVIFGDPKHSEVIGLNANAEDKALVVEKKKDLKKIKKNSRVAFVSQTTQKIEEFKKIAEIFKKQCENLEVINTICLDSFNKKEEVKKIAAEVDIMIIIGGKNSNNTKKLAEISQKLGSKTYHIENSTELKKEWFKNAQKIGIAAGASTPDDSIKEVVERIRQSK